MGPDRIRLQGSVQHRERQTPSGEAWTHLHNLLHLDLNELYVLNLYDFVNYDFMWDLKGEQCSPSRNHGSTRSHGASAHQSSATNAHCNVQRASVVANKKKHSEMDYAAGQSCAHWPGCLLRGHGWQSIQGAGRPVRPVPLLAAESPQAGVVTKVGRGGGVHSRYSRPRGSEAYFSACPPTLC